MSPSRAAALRGVKVQNSESTERCDYRVLFYKRTLGYRNLKVLAETQDCKPGSRVSTNRYDSKFGYER